MPSKKEISLLPDQENVNSFSARFIRWISTAGRFVLVLTELVVISAFLSRFWLDRQNSDLSETIRQQKAILNSTGDFEQDYRLLVSRLNNIRDNYATRPVFSDKILSVVKSTPATITFANFSLSPSESGQINANLNVIAYQEDSLVDFITNLKLNPDISSVNINQISKKEKENQYQANINLVFQKVDPAKNEPI